MRGKERNGNAQRYSHRITPAYAGKSVEKLPPAGTAEDHPRLCGEKLFGVLFSSTSIGSPPPMRGKDYANCTKTSYARITPAYAGKSRAVQKRRGTNVGSPPPMRGKGTSRIIPKLIVRITPAYAGKSYGSVS